MAFYLFIVQMLWKEDEEDDEENELMCFQRDCY